MNTIWVIGSVVAFLVGVLWFLGMMRTNIVESHPEQSLFIQGAASLASLDGQYIGVAHGYTGTSWQGKTIFQQKGSGINRFRYDSGLTEKYPFKLSLATALRDSNKEVIKLDYNQEGNPWWLTYIVDEMVETGPNEYLGKVHVRITDDIVFTLGYFSLKK
jgi:hypothetical protein